MSDIAISVEGLGKKYKIGRRKSGNLRDSLSSIFKRNSHNHPITQSPNQQINDFWALKDINFEVKQGEAVGIIGRNGAGKSTLLKILSRITKPTTGRFEINGRVSSLLEVGTGFHMELTGRENIYLNGTILGMKRKEIKAKFDEIVAFSGVEEFIDTPVKHYSSGMKVRLAFSVAAHLEPEILIIDEVLAVGDAEFQKKCLGKMEDVTGQGRTVLFVSHNLGAVNQLCSKAIFLSNGKLTSLGPTEKIINDYISDNMFLGGIREWKNSSKPKNNDFIIEKVTLSQRGKFSSELIPYEDIEVDIYFQNLIKDQNTSVGIQLFTNLETAVLSSVNWSSSTLNIDPFTNGKFSEGRFHSKCKIPEGLLNEGNYYINVVLLKNHNKVSLIEKKVISFSIVNTGYMREGFHQSWLGVVRPKLFWHTNKISNESN